MPRGKNLILIVLTSSAAALLALCYGYFVEPARLAVNAHELKIKGWDSAFDGFRVAVISDIHGGSNGADAEKLRRIVTTVNAQNVDAVFLLGDYISPQGWGRPQGSRALRMQPAEVAENLSGMHPRYGAYLVLGNHDEWYGTAELSQAFEAVGYTVLDGEMAEVAINAGKKLRIIGLRDHTTVTTWQGYSEANRKLLEPTEGQGSVIALQHSPDVVPAVAGDLPITRDTMLLFAGHTHGGQIWLPVIGAPIVPSMFGQKYAHGHIRDAGIDVFVTTGVGTSILPFRFLVPPEIAIVTIRSTPAP